MSEQTEKPIESWDVKKARKMAEKVTERYGATPYGFYFSTRERGPKDLDSKKVKTSGVYYLNCRVRTIEEVREKADPKESILLSNMEGNGWKAVVETTKGWKGTYPLEKGDTVLV